MQTPCSNVLVSGDADVDPLSCPICQEPNRPALYVLLLKDEKLHSKDQITCGHHYCFKCASAILNTRSCAFCRREVFDARLDESANAAYVERLCLHSLHDDVEQEIAEVKAEVVHPNAAIVKPPQEAITLAAAPTIVAPTASVEKKPSAPPPAPLPNANAAQLPIRVKKAEPLKVAEPPAPEKARQRIIPSKPKTERPRVTSQPQAPSEPKVAVPLPVNTNTGQKSFREWCDSAAPMFWFIFTVLCAGAIVSVVSAQIATLFG